jgi:hypothetical protein
MRYMIWFVLLLPVLGQAQENFTWKNVDSLYGPLPSSVHIYYTTSPVDTAPFRAFYIEASLKDKKLDFATDTTFKRRLTPSAFYEKEGHPLIVVNGSFFSFETNRNLTVVMNRGRLLAPNSKTMRSSRDTTKRLATHNSALGIDKKRRADVAWIKGDSVSGLSRASQVPVRADAGNFFYVRQSRATGERQSIPAPDSFKPWKMRTAIGGGPVLVQNGEINITNSEENMFAGKAIADKHPRTAMGYTRENKLIILIIEGRNKGVAHGATLRQEAQLLRDLGCLEALNLDGGGSSCLLVNGRETIKPSDKEGQRALPAVFMIRAH